MDEPSEVISDAHSRNGTYMRTSEVARLLLVSTKTVSRWADDEKLPFTRTLGGHRRFPAEKILELADQIRAEAQGIPHIDR